MADRHVVASGEDESQHDENRMRDIHIDKSGSERASGEQPDKMERTVRFEQEAPYASLSSATHVSLEYLASGERRVLLEPVLVKNAGHVDDDILRDGWTRESLHQRSVGFVSSRCWRSQEK